MKNAIIFVLAFSIIFGYSWDGKRKGFLLGIGGGVSSTSSSAFDVPDGAVQTVTKISPITNSRIGYAFTNLNAVELYFMTLNADLSFNGINYHKWYAESAQSNSWFGGFGVIRRAYSSVTRKDVDAEDSDYGFAANIGYGREIVSHAAIELNLTLGYIDTSNPYYVMMNEKQIMGSFSFSLHLLGY